MKKVVFAACLLFFAGLSLGLAQDETIGSLFKDKIDDKIPVKVYIKEVVDSSGHSLVTPESFKEELTQSLHQRKSMKFEVVDIPAESDIHVTAAIKSFRYMERGPFKLSPGVDTILLDVAATMTENYADMTVEYTVVDAKSDKTLWKGVINEYIKQKMTPEESAPLIFDVVTRAFIWKCFGKSNIKDSNRRDVF